MSTDFSTYSGASQPRILSAGIALRRALHSGRGGPSPHKGLLLVRHALIGRELASKVSACPSLGPFGMVGYYDIVIFGRRTSEHTGEQFLAVNRQIVSRRVSWHVSSTIGAACLHCQ